MSARLNDADRRAVDSLLDGNACTDCSPSDMQQQQRLVAARRWLELMGAMPAEEPASNLVAATIARAEATPRVMPGSEGTAVPVRA